MYALIPLGIMVMVGFHLQILSSFVDPLTAAAPGEFTMCEKELVTIPGNFVASDCYSTDPVWWHSLWSVSNWVERHSILWVIMLLVMVNLYIVATEFVFLTCQALWACARAAPPRIRAVLCSSNFIGLYGGYHVFKAWLMENYGYVALAVVLFYACQDVLFAFPSGLSRGASAVTLELSYTCIALEFTPEEFGIYESFHLGLSCVGEAISLRSRSWWSQDLAEYLFDPNVYLMDVVNDDMCHEVIYILAAYLAVLGVIVVSSWWYPRTSKPQPFSESVNEGKTPIDVIMLYYYSDLAATLMARLNGCIKDMKEAVGCLEQALKKIKALKDEKKSAVATLEAKITQLSQDLFSRTLANRDLRQQVTNATDKVANIEYVFQKAGLDPGVLLRLEEQLAVAQRQLTVAQDENQSLRGQQDNSSRQRTDLQKELDDARKELADVRKQGAFVQDQVAAKDECLDGIRNQNATLQREVERLFGDNVRMVQIGQALEAEHFGLKAQHENLQGEHRALQGLMEQQRLAASERDLLESRINSVEAERDQATCRGKTLEAELAAMTARAEAAEQALLQSSKDSNSKDAAAPEAPQSSASGSRCVDKEADRNEELVRQLRRQIDHLSTQLEYSTDARSKAAIDMVRSEAQRQGEIQALLEDKKLLEEAKMEQDQKIPRRLFTDKYERLFYDATAKNILQQQEIRELKGQIEILKEPQGPKDSALAKLEAAVEHLKGRLETSERERTNERIALTKEISRLEEEKARLERARSTAAMRGGGGGGGLFIPRRGGPRGGANRGSRGGAS